MLKVALLLLFQDAIAFIHSRPQFKNDFLYSFNPQCITYNVKISRIDYDLTAT